MTVDQDHMPETAPGRLQIREAAWDDVKHAFAAGVADLKRNAGLSMFFGLVYALFGAVLIAGLIVFDQIWIVIAAGVGFPLVAPFLAAGLYEMSRRHTRGETYTAADIFLVIFNQQRREFGWMSFVVLFVFWIWAYQVRLVLALTIHYQGFQSMDGLLVSIFTTPSGLTFLLIGTIVGAVLATILFTITVISMPLLLDKEVDFITAMITSVQTVLKSPAVMLGWGACVGAMTLFSVLCGLVGVIFVFPLLGHVTWHLYQRLISEG